MRWLKQLFLRRKLYGELSEEIRAHLEEKVEELVAGGMLRKEAEYAARREFGNVTLLEEEARETWRWGFLEDLFTDVRYGLRILRKSPAFTAVAVLTLALGIGANTAIFSLVSAVMLRHLPVPHPEQLVFFKWRALRDPDTHHSYFWGGCPGNNTVSRSGASSCSFPYPAYEQLRWSRDVLAGVFGFIPPSGVSEITVNGQTAQGRGELVSGNFFTALGVKAAAGRVLDAMDDVSGAEPVIVFSYGYWQSRFGSDPSLVGKTVLLNGVPFTLAGVAASGFSGLETGVPRQFWIPLASRYRADTRFPKERETDGGSLWIQIAGRLKPDVDTSKAEAALTAIFASNASNGGDALFKAQDKPRIELLSASRGMESLRVEFSEPLFALMAAVGLILLVACANVAGLLLARGVARQSEMATRLALGAGRPRIFRQLLTESLLLAAAGAGLGVLFAYWGAISLAEFLAKRGGGEYEIAVKPDPLILAFTAGLCCVVGLLAGLAPALRASRVELLPDLKRTRSARASSARLRAKRSTLSAGLVVMQIGVSLLVLSGAGLLVRTLTNLQRVNLGFDARNVLLFNVDPILTSYKGPKLQQLYSNVQRELAGAPGVVSVSYSAVSLLSGANMTTGLRTTEAGKAARVYVEELPVGLEFFRTMRVPLLTGRSFAAADYENASRPQPIIVNQAFVRRIFGVEKALGRRMSEGDDETADFEVVGVVADARYDSLRKESEPTMYLPMKAESGTFEARTAADPRALIPVVREILSKLDRNLVLLDAKTQVEQIDDTLYQERLLASLSSLFGLLAVALACIGLYGLLAYEITRRTHEIGVRVALGAERRDVLRLVLRRGIALAFAGIFLGLGAAFASTRYVQSLLYGIKPTDSVTLVAVSSLLFAVAMAACYVPARRAMRVDPMVALRYE